MPVVYQELHRIASGYLSGERAGHTLQPTALIHEVYLRLLGTDHPTYVDRTHFLGVAAYLMRQVLTEHARRRSTSKRGEGAVPIALNERLWISRLNARG